MKLIIQKPQLICRRCSSPFDKNRGRPAFLCPKCRVDDFLKKEQRQTNIININSKEITIQEFISKPGRALITFKSGYTMAFDGERKVSAPTALLAIKALQVLDPSEDKEPAIAFG